MTVQTRADVEPLAAAIGQATVHLVDDDVSVRTAVGRALRATGFSVALYTSGEELLSAHPQRIRGCVVLDLSLQGLDGLAVQSEISRRYGAVPLVFLSGRGAFDSCVEAMRSGATDFLEKPVSTAVLTAAIHRALAEHSPASPTGAAAQADAEAERLLATLPEMQLKVLRLVAAGQSNKRIAAELAIAERTVKQHRHVLSTKFGCRRLSEVLLRLSRLLR